MSICALLSSCRRIWRSSALSLSWLVLPTTCRWPCDCQCPPGRTSLRSTFLRKWKQVLPWKTNPGDESDWQLPDLQSGPLCGVIKEINLFFLLFVFQKKKNIKRTEAQRLLLGVTEDVIAKSGGEGGEKVSQAFDHTLTRSHLSWVMAKPRNASPTPALATSPVSHSVSPSSTHAAVAASCFDFFQDFHDRRIPVRCLRTRNKSISQVDTGPILPRPPHRWKPIGQLSRSPSLGSPWNLKCLFF